MESDFRTLPDMVRLQARQHPGRTAMIFGERRTTYAALDEITARVAHRLRADGVRPGARVAIVAKDSDHAYAALLGIVRAGAVALPVSWRLAPPEIEYILADAEAAFLFVGPDQLPRLQPVVGNLAGLKKVVILGDAAPAADGFAAWLEAAPGHEPDVPVRMEDVAVQMYTSGTSGRPKGVQLAHGSPFAVMREHDRATGRKWIDWSERDVSAVVLPIYHIGGLWWAIRGWANGATNVLVEAFLPARVIDLLEKHQVTKVCLVPAMIQMVLSEPSCASADLSSLEYVAYGGAPIPDELLARALARFGCRFAQLYGMTETGNVAVSLLPEDHDAARNKRKAAGRPLPGVEVKVIDAAGKTLPPHGVGEVCLRSPANMVAYWRLPDATRDTLSEGWVRTGDAGYMDEEGYVFIHDRIKDMIIYAGENIYPAEVENALYEHPAVAEVAVIGVPDERWGEMVKALVVLAPGGAATSAQLAAHTRARIADFKVPRSWEYVATLPRTPSGKLRRAELRAAHWKGRDRQVN